MNHPSSKPGIFSKTLSTLALAALVFSGFSSVSVPFARAQAAGPVFSHVAVVPNSGTFSSGQLLEVYFQEMGLDAGVTLAGACQVNGVSVGPLDNLTGGLYRVLYTVGGTDADRNAGDLPVNCTFQNASGATTTVTAFNDGNTVAIDSLADGITPPEEEEEENTGGPVFSNVAVVPNSGTVEVNGMLEVFFQESSNDSTLSLGSSCTVNGVEVTPLHNLTGGLYKVIYTVGASDASRAAGMVPLNCILQNASGATTSVVAFNDGNTVAINASTTPEEEEEEEEEHTGAAVFSSVAAVPNTGTINVGGMLEVYFQESHHRGDISLGSSCTVNGVAVSPLHNLSDGLYKVVYTVGANDASRAAGQVPLNCILQNASGSTTSVVAFTDGNTVAINASTTPPTGGNGNTGTIEGEVNGGVNDAPLAVTSIVQNQSTAVADGTYANGWKWTFNVTVPSNETSLQMKFANWTDGAGHTISPAGNMRISSLQANSTSTVDITAADTYSASLVLNSDMATSTAGRQVQIVVEMKVPTTTVNGSYSTTYGLRTF
jgi:hypothetical protein